MCTNGLEALMLAGCRRICLLWLSACRLLCC